MIVLIQLYLLMRGIYLKKRDEQILMLINEVINDNNVICEGCKKDIIIKSVFYLDKL